MKVSMHNISFQLNKTIEVQLVKIAVEKFKDFIKEMGGFEDIIDYFHKVKKNRDKENEVTSTGSSIFSRTTMVAGALAIGAMLFSKH